MKKYLLPICASIITTVQYAQEINFEHGTWAEIKAKAKEKNMLIFLDAYTTWCGPCKAMAKNTFTNPGVAAYYNGNFINAKIDMEKGDGPEIAKLYNVNCYPNLLFIDSDGKLVHRSAGVKDSADFIALGKTAQNPDENFAYMQKQFDSGNSNPAFVAEYLHFLTYSCMPANEAAIRYFTNAKENEMLSAQNWGILRDYVNDVHSAPFDYLVKNRKEYALNYSIDSINTKIFDTYKYQSNKLAYQKNFDSAAYLGLVHETDKIEFERSEELQLTMMLPYYEKLENWDNYYTTGKTLVEKYRQKDWEFLNTVSWTIYEKSSVKTQLSDAELWAKKSVEIVSDEANLDTYANLLFKNGKRGDAIKTEKKALETARAANHDTKVFEEKLLEFERSK